MLYESIFVKVKPKVHFTFKNFRKIRIIFRIEYECKKENHIVRSFLKTTKRKKNFFHSFVK
jgi:hypothetical protein